METSFTSSKGLLLHLHLSAFLLFKGKFCSNWAVFFAPLLTLYERRIPEAAGVHFLMQENELGCWKRNSDTQISGIHKANKE